MRNIIFCATLVVLYLIELPLGSAQGDKEPTTCDHSPAFEVESENRLTFGSVDRLPCGAKVQIAVLVARPHNLIRLHKCGPKCDTASTVKVWSNHSKGQLLSYTVEVPGYYYVWVEDPRYSGAQSAVQIEEWACAGRQLHLVFSSGLEVEVTANDL